MLVGLNEDEMAIFCNKNYSYWVRFVEVLESVNGVLFFGLAVSIRLDGVNKKYKSEAIHFVHYE